MSLHPSAFLYLRPTDEQAKVMEEVRELFTATAMKLDELLPDGPDKTYMMRQLRDCGMWALVGISRHPDGSPRG